MIGSTPSLSRVEQYGDEEDEKNGKEERIDIEQEEGADKQYQHDNLNISDYDV